VFGRCFQAYQDFQVQRRVAQWVLMLEIIETNWTHGNSCFPTRKKLKTVASSQVSIIALFLFLASQNRLFLPFKMTEYRFFPGNLAILSICHSVREIFSEKSCLACPIGSMSEFSFFLDSR